MNRSISFTVRIICLYALQALAFVANAIPQEWKSSPRPVKPREKLHGVVSRQQLTPLLRSTNATLNYSPDGRYLALQDRSGIYLLSREPLKVLGYIDEPNSYPARFSSDSQLLIVVSVSLGYSRWSVQDGKMLDRRVILINDGCVDAQLSPDGALLVCYRPDFRLAVLQLSTGQWIFSDLIRTSTSPSSFFPVLLDFDAPFAGPFGFQLARDLEPLANRGVYDLPMAFSPDSRMLIAGDEQDAARVDLLEMKKSSLPGGIQKSLGGTVAIEDDARVLLISNGNPEKPTVRSLKDGSVLSTPNFKAGSVSLATNARYARLRDTGIAGTRVFDLENNLRVEIPENIAVDVYGGEIAGVTENGELFLLPVGGHTPFASVLLPPEGLPLLRRASVTPALDAVALAVDGEAALFQTANGRRISSLPQFAAGNFIDSATGFFLTPVAGSAVSLPPEYAMNRIDADGTAYAVTKGREATAATIPQKIQHLDVPTGKTSIAWAGGKELLRDGGPVFFDYSFQGSSGREVLLPRATGATWGIPLTGGTLLPQGVGVPFRLRALDLATGKELWSRAFAGVPPIPYADPQGERLVLSWRATSLGASSAARRWPVAKDALKKATLVDQDSFLEAVDARSGKSLGGVLVQSGTGPTNFDWIFSVGDLILFSRDTVRVHAYSMHDGELKAKLVGVMPSASPQSNLLVLETATGRLAIYDLNTASKLDEQMFPDPIAYTHFSADGQRLLVLTENQDIFVLDVAAVRQGALLNTGGQTIGKME